MGSDCDKTFWQLSLNRFKEGCSRLLIGLVPDSAANESEATVNANNIRQDSASSEPPLPDDGEDMARSADAHAQMQHRSGPPTPEPMPSPESLIASGQYLVDCPSWLAFLGEDKRMKYSNHFISRNDKIWELISTEIRFVDLLLVIRDVFLKAFPPKRCDSLDLAENLFPHIEVLLEAHTRLLYHMLAEHTATPDHVAKNLGRCLMKVLTDEMMNRLVEAYGALMFVQSSLSDRLGRLKADPAFAERLSACERDPRTKRRTVTDCYMIILQRWSKIETLLSGIISDTIVQDDSTELDDLNASRRAAQNLLLGMQQNMTDLVHAEKLRYFADNLLEDYVDINDGDPKHRTLIEWMKAPDAKLINYDKLTVQRRKEGGKFCKIELYGVALKDCFFLLRQDPETGKFAIYRDTNMPPILIWTLHFGYFRDQAGSPLTFIIIMDTNNASPTLDKFECSTYDEVARWQKVFTDGFDNFGKVNEPELETLLQKNTRQLEFAEARRRRQEEKLELISSLTTDIFAQWEVRNIAFRALMVDEGLATPASRSNSSRSTNRDPFFNRRSITSQSDLQQSEDEQIRVRNLHDRFMKSVMRLASLCGEVDSTGLSRSASDAADRRLSCSSAMPPTLEIAAAYDSLKKKSEKESITLRIKSRSQNRFSNILRTGSRRRADGASVIASPTDFQRDDWTPGMDLSDGASETSLATFSNALIADIQELARSLLENYDNQYIHCLEMEKDIIRLKAEVDIAGGQTSINAKRELEYLRSLQKKTECEQKAWNAYKQKEEARLEREDQKLKNLAKDLAEKQQHYEEDRRTLQEQIDLHASRGIEMGRLKAHGSTCSLHFAPQTEVEATSLPLTQSQSLRNETRPLPPRTMQVYTVKVPKSNLPAPVTKELEDRLQKPDLVGLPGTNRPRVDSSESLNGLHPGHSPHPRNHEFEYTGGASMNTARPPAGPRTIGDLPKTPGASTTNSTLGDLPAKLATKSQSKSRNMKKLLRH